jgi:ADP-L-glycero-D-manno-heptose 6-epimerase
VIILTGAAGFIGSCLLSRLIDDGLGPDTVIVDDFSSSPSKALNYAGKAYATAVERSQFWRWVEGRERDIRVIVHLGARTDTMETDSRVFDELNVASTKAMWSLAARHQIPLVYASSAAVYGDGVLGFSDDERLTGRLRPLNAYGRSKHAIDAWVLAQSSRPPFWAGLRFFNVYGPNEAHKRRMASVVFHAYRQLETDGVVRLFRSHRADYADGAQRRDFVYVADAVDVVRFFMTGRAKSGLYNVGTGRARTFADLAAALFRALRREPSIAWIDMPESLRATYQYFTEAEVAKLRAAGYDRPFTSLEDGVADYAGRYLRTDRVA